MMMNFEAVLRHFWQKALDMIKDSKGLEKDLADDQKAIAAVTETDTELSTRQKDLRAWFDSYKVFQGLKREVREQITHAVLCWSDKRDTRRDLTTPKALADAHRELMEVIQKAYGKPRDFTSLASKALWLCYPHSVPIYDAWTRTALYVISKIEDGINPIAEKTPESKKTPEYEQFVHVWKQLYSKYKETIENLDVGAYPYRVRVFDRILLLIGRPSYQTDWASPSSTQS
jgi:hypothetical protein